MAELLEKLKQAGSRFQMDGEIVDGRPFGSGHINETYLVTCRRRYENRRYILQKINHHIFKAPLALMENIHRVTQHLQRKKPASPTGVDFRQCLRLVPSTQGGICWRDSDGYYWRAYHFIEDAVSLDQAKDPGHTYEAAAVVGRFQKDLADLPGDRLHETIADFHHTEKRFVRLNTAIQKDAFDRARHCRPEIDFAMARESMASMLIRLIESGDLPERITHNDTKLNNVLIDRHTHKGLCLIDLDTVMPGSILYDFGDLMRTGTGRFMEDEKGEENIRMEMPLFEALVHGYLSEAGSFLSEVERAHLVFAGKLITFEVGIRFLTDYLCGDRYFKAYEEMQNLNRCRTQFTFLRSLEANEAHMQNYIHRMCR